GPIERELRSELTYVISNRDGRLLLGPETLTAQRSYGADRNNVTGNTEEEQLLRNEMHQELIRQLVLRLSRVSPAVLEAREQALDGSGQPAPTRANSMPHNCSASSAMGWRRCMSSAVTIHCCAARVRILSARPAGTPAAKNTWSSISIAASTGVRCARPED